MSNKSRLEANNASLQAILDKVNTLPDAGGGGSGASGEHTGLVEVTMGDMHEPGSYWLTMDLDGINLNDKLVVIIHRAGSLDVPILTLTRTSTSESFEVTNHPSNGYISTNVYTITIMDNSITVVGSASIVNFNYEYTAYTSYDAGGSGGGSVETCTVDFNIFRSTDKALLSATVLNANGQIDAYHEQMSSGFISNVVCGSLFMVAFTQTMGITTKDGAEFLEAYSSGGAATYVFKITATSNDTVVITLSMSSGAD